MLHVSFRGGAYVLASHGVLDSHGSGHCSRDQHCNAPERSGGTGNDPAQNSCCDFMPFFEQIVLPLLCFGGCAFFSHAFIFFLKMALEIGGFVKNSPSSSFLSCLEH